MAERKKLPIWAQAGRAVALLAVLVLFVSAYFVSIGTPQEVLTWERIGSSAFGIAVMGVALLFMGRAQTRK
ncbi:hypothetical protein TESS_TESS_01823 [Tessaracoccus sp. O5.2]|uniref:hypothetical protein n=1 Tax=Tessaracoccus sp. O5.2 TaxID=3157622 RepID=UPI0035E8DB59